MAKIKVRYQDGSEGIEEFGSAEEEMDKLIKHLNKVAKIFKNYTGRDPNPTEMGVIFDLMIGHYDDRKREVVTYIGPCEEDN